MLKQQFQTHLKLKHINLYALLSRFPNQKYKGCRNNRYFYVFYKMRCKGKIVSKHSERRTAELDLESVSFACCLYNAPRLYKYLCLSPFSKTATVTLSTFRALSICLMLVLPEAVSLCAHVVLHTYSHAHDL